LEPAGGLGLDLDVGPGGRTVAAWLRLGSEIKKTFLVEVARFREGEWTRPARLARIPGAAIRDVDVVVAPAGVFVLWGEEVFNTNTIVVRWSRLTSRGWTAARTLARRVNSYSAAAADGPLSVVMIREPLAGGSGVFARRVLRDGSLSRMVKLARRTRTQSPLIHVSRTGVVTVAWVKMSSPRNPRDCLVVTERIPHQAWRRPQCLPFDLSDAFERGDFGEETDIAGNAHGDVAVTFQVDDAGETLPSQVLLARTRAGGEWSPVTTRPGRDPRLAMGRNRTLAFAWTSRQPSRKDWLHATWKPMRHPWAPTTTITSIEKVSRSIGASDIALARDINAVWTRYDNGPLPVLAATHHYPTIGR